MTIEQLFNQPEYTWLRSQVEKILWWGGPTSKSDAWKRYSSVQRAAEKEAAQYDAVRALDTSAIKGYAGLGQPIAKAETYAETARREQQSQAEARRKAIPPPRPPWGEGSPDPKSVKATEAMLREQLGLDAKTPLTPEQYNQLRQFKHLAALPYVKQVYPMMLYKKSGTTWTTALVQNANDHQKMLREGWTEDRNG